MLFQMKSIKVIIWTTQMPNECIIGDQFSGNYDFAKCRSRHIRFHRNVHACFFTCQSRNSASNFVE